MEEKDLKELSGQLMNPNGEKGVEVASMMNETNRGMTFNSIDNLDLKGGEDVLEIGHGNAGHLDYLFGKAADLNYKGIDISELMIQEATQINRSRVEEQKASFIHYNGLDIPFENESFDAVFSVNTIYFWEKPIEFLNEIARVLKNEGRFALTFADASFMEQLPFTKYHFTLYRLEDALELIKRSGLQVEKTDLQKETVKSKTGELVEREFVTVVLRR